MVFCEATADLWDLHKPDITMIISDVTVYCRMSQGLYMM